MERGTRDTYPPFSKRAPQVTLTRTGGIHERIAPSPVTAVRSTGTRTRRVRHADRDPGRLAHARGRPRLLDDAGQGADATLDLGTWNIEWFGDAGNGPSDEQLQLDNVAHVISDLDLDLWSLQEVVAHAQFDSLVARLDGYGGLLADDPFVTNGPEYYSGFSDTEQKVALLYKTALARVDSARVILTEIRLRVRRPPSGEGRPHRFAERRDAAPGGHPSTRQGREQR